jgi:hypothetical protein
VNIGIGKFLFYFTKLKIPIKFKNGIIWYSDQNIPIRKYFDHIYFSMNGFRYLIVYNIHIHYTVFNNLSVIRWFDQ